MYLVEGICRCRNHHCTSASATKSSNVHDIATTKHIASPRSCHNKSTKYHKILDGLLDKRSARKGEISTSVISYK